MAGHWDLVDLERNQARPPMSCTPSMLRICRPYVLSIIGGVISGILGLTGLTGFILYFLIMAITSVGLIAKAKFSVYSYFDCWNRILFDGFMGGLMSFMLFWTFAYDIVHIF